MQWLKFLINSEFENRVAIRDEIDKKTYTYKELNLLTASWCDYLDKENFNTGDVLAYHSLNSLDHLTLLFACAIKKVIFLPLNFRLSEGEIKELLIQTKPKQIITRLECSLNLGEVRRENIKLELVEPLEEIVLEAFDPCMILFTSGSTGNPKGVLFHNEMIYRNQVDTCLDWGLLPSDRAVIETPFFHTGAYNVLCLPLLSLGAEVVLTPGFCVEHFYTKAPFLRASVYFAVPTMFQFIKDDPRFEEFSSHGIRFVISGGAYCPESLIKAYQEKNILFKQGFGLTEVGPNCFLLDDDMALLKVGSIGRPMGASQVLLFKEGHIVEEAGQVGELLIKGEHMTRGFYNMPTSYSEKLINGYYRTGDLAYFDKDGFFYIAGRKKEMYISGGENVYPAEVEKKLVTHPLIDDAVVVPITHEKWGEVGFAFIRSFKDISLEELREYLNPILSRYKHPHGIKVIPSFPLLANGKIDKLKLKEIANQPEGSMQ